MHDLPVVTKQAKHKLKGLILHTHQKSKGEKGDGSVTGPLMDERSRAAMDDLFDAQVPLSSTLRAFLFCCTCSLGATRLKVTLLSRFFRRNSENVKNCFKSSSGGCAI